MSKRVYGIDLGTTYSCIAHVDEHGKAVVLPNTEGDLTTPSVVYFESEDDIVVGKAAKEVAAVEPDSVVSTVKRVMGDPEWEFAAFGKTYKPQDISSFIVRKVVGDAEQNLPEGEKIENVVITCPAYFGVNEKEATKQAGILAGLNVLYVIPEPTAAALCYGIDQSEDQVIMVYDLGGGTFDVSLIEIKGGEINVICTGGDHQLGGKNWDDAVVNYLAGCFEQETGVAADDVIEDVETYQELLNSAEEAKKTLSSRKSTARPVRFAGKRAKVELTREKLDEITAQYLERTLSLTEQEMATAGEMGYPQIDKLLLVGGSTYMPQVMEGVQGKFDVEILRFDPNQAVAKGAALYGFKCFLDDEIKERVAEQTGQDAGEVDLTIGGKVVEEAEKQVALDHGLTLPAVEKFRKAKITNVTSKSFGIVVIEPRRGTEVVSNLITRNTQVPVSISKQFGTHEDGQESADLRCMENQSDNGQVVETDECREMGKAELVFKKPLKAGSPVEVTFNLGPDGLLHMQGKDLTTGQEIDARFETDSIMQVDELEEAKSRNLSMAVS